MENIENEIWLPIIGFEGLYEGSSLGRVASCKRIFLRKKQRGTQIVEWRRRILTIRRSIYGYCCVALIKNGVRHNKVVHRLVAQAFIPNPENKPEVNHKNLCKTDARVINLEWCTRQENVSHAKINGKISNPILYGQDNPKTKILLDTHTGVFYFGYREASIALNIPQKTLKNWITGISKNKSNMIHV